ncbi:MAG: L,D-transpeptidase, partial [Clostridia bacterium]|nr:L,D-transpeptidase [Clostridia bacterium]
MPKRRFPIVPPALLFAVFLALTAPPAGAAPLTDLFPSDDTLIIGQSSLEIAFDAGAPGTLLMTARILGDSGEPQLLKGYEVSAGPGSVSWDGTLGGRPVAAGEWEVYLALRCADGSQSPPQRVLVYAQEAPAAPTVVPKELRPRRTPSPDRQMSAFPDPHERCFWNMDLENLDPEDPGDWPAIWEILQQPITVLDAGPKDHIYPLTSPDADPKKAANLAGQLHGASQGVHVISAENGWALIEAYANDGYNAPSQSLRKLTAKLIHGYVRADRLKAVTPDPHIGLLIDKLRQRLYVFQDGQMIGELLISTGKPTSGQPNAETPAGEFLADSWVGLFANGNMQCDLAIRINGGVLLHEVPYLEMADGTRGYDYFRPYLGQKASHGCVRVQDKPNDQGMNMRWLWDHLKRNAKVLIWDDEGREMPPPDPALPVYYNPDGGKNYHLNQYCPYVKNRFLPLTGFMYGELNFEPYDRLTPCATCN